MKEDEFSDLFKGYVSDKKTKKVNLDIAIDISSDALIPAGYISHDGERFEYYRRLYNVRSESELLKIISEIIDRYGPLPEVVENLIFAIRLRVIALSFGFNRLVFKNNVLAIEFPPDNNSAFYHTIFPGILDAVATGEYGSLINQDNKVFLHIPCDSRDTSLHILSTLQRFMIPG